MSFLISFFKSLRDKSASLFNLKAKKEEDREQQEVESILSRITGLGNCDKLTLAEARELERVYLEGAREIEEKLNLPKGSIQPFPPNAGH